MIITAIRHDWPEKAGLSIQRPNGLKEYTFLHFMTEARFEIEGEEVNAPPGTCIFFAPHVPQYFFSRQELLHNWMHCTPALGELLEKYSIPQNRLLHPADTRFISDIFRKAEVEFFSDTDYREELLHGYLCEFLIRTSRALDPGNTHQQVPRSIKDTLRDVRHQVLSRPEKRWNISEMAALASLSTSRFHAVYKAVFATSPMHDVIEAKIGYAKSLLTSDDSLGLMQVAEMCGYSDQYHFIRQFRTVTGRTPGAYRREFQTR